MEQENLFLIFDTETTGLFETKNRPWEGKRKARNPLLHPEDYPHVFQLAFILFKESGEVVEQFSSYIKPDGWNIPSERKDPEIPNFWEQHGYTDELCEREGILAKEALEKFASALEKTNYLVAHNMDFDRPVMLAEFSRYKIQVSRKDKPKLLCTMKSTIDIVQAPHSQENIDKWSFLAFRNKFPKLIELYEKLFNESFDGAHDALVDVKACFRCLKELIKLKIITL